MPLPMRGALKAEYPEVKLAVQVMDGGAQILKDDKLVNEGITFTDNEFSNSLDINSSKETPTRRLKN
jgi:ADP-heptose:LPS heptosyltransferase